MGGAGHRKASVASEKYVSEAFRTQLALAFVSYIIFVNDEGDVDISEKDDMKS